MKPLLLSVLFLSLAGRLSAGDALRLSWRFVTGGALTFRPALDLRGRLYLAAGDRFLYAVDASGVEAWRFPLGGRPSSSPVIAYDGTVLAATGAGRLWAVGPDGRARWSFTAPSRPALTPCLGADGTIYLPAGDTLYALSYSGEERWRYQLKSELAEAPVAGADGTLFLATGDRRLLALAPTGERAWELELPGRVSAPALAADGSLYVGASGVHHLSARGSLLWSYPIPAQTASPVLRPDGTLLAGAANGKLYLLSPEGARLAELALDAPVRYAATASGADTAIVTTSGRSVYALRVRVSPEGGGAGAGAAEAGRSAAATTGSAASVPTATAAIEVIGRFEAGEAVHYAALGRDGSVYLGSEDWVLYCLVGLAGGPAASPWPMAFHDVQHTGRAGGLEDLEGPAALALRELALAEEESLKQRALDDIERHLAGERFLPVHLAVLEGVLGGLTAEGVTVLTRSSGAKLPGYPRVRERACRLLGRLGSEGARQTLMASVLYDSDPGARLAALEALGRIGADPQGELGALLAREARRPDPDERLLLTGLETIARILGDSPGRAAPEDFRALAALAGASNSRRVAEQARRILRELQRRLP